MHADPEAEHHAIRVAGPHASLIGCALAGEEIDEVVKLAANLDRVESAEEDASTRED
jgi:hypothetical protein